MVLKKTKIEQALVQLNLASKAYHQGKDPHHLKFMALTKAFEIAIECAWKTLKIRVEDEGYETLSPKETFRQAAQLHLISDAESWLAYLHARNNSVHDYFGIPEQDFVALVEAFYKAAKKISL